MTTFSYLGTVPVAGYSVRTNYSTSPAGQGSGWTASGVGGAFYVASGSGLAGGPDGYRYGTLFEGEPTASFMQHSLPALPGDFTAGETVTVSRYFRPTVAGVAKVVADVAAGVQIHGAELTIGPDEWTRLHVTFTVPAGATRLRTLFWFTPSDTVPEGATVWQTGTLIERSAVPGTYFDGATTDTPLAVHAWLGSAGVSESTETSPVFLFPSVVVPTVVDGYTSTREAQSLAHPILGRPDPEVTLREAALRSGTLTLLFPDEDDSAAAELAFSQPGVWQMVDDDRDTVGMSFVVAGGAITRELHDETRNDWLLTIPYREVS